MSALTRGPDTVICTPRVIVGKDRTNSNVLGPGKAVTYRGVSVQPAGLAAFGSAENDGVIDADYIVLKAFTPPWVGGPHSTVTWNGEEYDQVGVVKRYGRGIRSRHEEIKLKARGTAVK